ncbi:gastrula zinc finger protein XlCGF7.1-like [Acanthaster planci]|uniref:Gastrula zinc finger protein XlCGF7.1-like n=1 Tax=Acanthaster planci TaxID=133434 RepID=A0A8B7Y5T4_ACAPL|nr:gastrula zinc finger protein XlCGF7.1-like [Acanthaster planci]XP_022087710.1 gastrula zinc finger protein XlCGF7.1-like [Acanthaster planci]XP_022087711.1 gastrula zinc finger protein XlCGF7.1-like [Acanthaster planci]XP_022087712.1 gastrula zinc finger protein XlCGF7.1-like [Acanthaster planci]
MDLLDDEEDVEATLARLQREWKEDQAKTKIDIVNKPSYSYGCARTSGVAVANKSTPKKQKQQSKSVLKIKVVPCTPIQKHSNLQTAQQSKNASCQGPSSQRKTNIYSEINGTETENLPKSSKNSKEDSVRKLGPKRKENKHQGSYRCKECGQVFTFKGNLRRHEEWHFASANDFQCKECGKTFALKRNLARHLKLHIPVDPDYRPYACDKCDKSFQRAKTLYQHKKVIHSNKRPHACQFCVKTFKTFFNLQCHEAIHLNCKPYVCQFCGMAFIRSSYRTIHERIHTNERPFKCDVCDKSFTRGDHLKNHKKVHAKKKAKKSKNSK